MNTCEQCQAPIPLERRGKPLRFCSKACSNRACVARNPERSREAARAAYHRSSEAIAARGRAEDRRRDPGAARRESSRRYREAHPERIAAYREENRDRMNAYARDWHAANRERGEQTNREWRSKNAERYRETSRELARKRRARLAGAPVVETVDRAAIIARDKQRCHLCGKRVPLHDIDLDHIVPLAVGGEHTAANLAVSHSRCNRIKGTRPANDQLRLVG